jgi:hypothetical protein
MQNHFLTQMHAIMDRVDAIDKVSYAVMRNYVDGDVTRLSPYISRRVLRAGIEISRQSIYLQRTPIKPLPGVQGRAAEISA